MSVARAFQGIQVSTAALALVAFLVGYAAGDLLSGVPWVLVGFALFTVATAAGLAVAAMEPELFSPSESRPRTL